MECSINSSGGSSVVIKEEPDDENDLNTAPPSGRVCVLNNLIGEVVGSEVTELSTSENPITTWQECDTKTDDFWESKDDIEIIDCHGYNNETVALVEAERFCLVKVLETNEIVTISSKQVRSGNDEDLKIVSHRGKQYHAVLFDTGDFPEIEIIKNKLIDYERKVAQYHNLRCTSLGVQTEIEVKEVHIQTGESAGAEQNLYYKLRSAFDVVLENHRELLESVQRVSAAHETPEEIPRQENTSPKPFHGTEEELSCVIRSPTVTHPDTSHEDIQQSRVVSPISKQKKGIKTKLISHNSSPNISLDAEQKGDKIKTIKAYCILCNTFQSQLARHLLRAHVDNERVKAFADLPQKNVNRLAALRKLRLEGYKAVKRKDPIRKGSRGEYKKCGECALFYSKRNFYRHYRTCREKKAPKMLKKNLKTGNSLKNVYLNQ